MMVLNHGMVFIVVVRRAVLVLWHMVESQGTRTVTLRDHGSRHAHSPLHGNALCTPGSPAVSHSPPPGTAHRASSASHTMAQS